MEVRVIQWMPVTMTTVMLAACGAVDAPTCAPVDCECTQTCRTTPVDAAVVTPPRDAGSADAGRPVDVDAGIPDAGARSVDAGVSCAPPSVTPSNEAVDGDFECGLPVFQSSGGGGRVERIAGRSGQALRFTSAAGLFNHEFASTWRFRVTQPGRYCARAFVRGTAQVITLRLYLGPSGFAAGEQFELPGALPSWTRIPPSITAVSAMAQAGDEGFLVFVEKNHVPGATIELDDVDVWRSTDGTCRER